MKERIEQLLKKTPANIRGKVIEDHIILDIVGEDVHYWSPQLNFRVEENEFNPEQTIIAGLIGPRPTVWTMFMFIYFAVGIIGFIIASFGISKWVIGEYSHLVLALPIAILFMLTAYITGKYGEHLGKEQIDWLKQFVRDAIAMEEKTKNEIPLEK